MEPLSALPRIKRRGPWIAAGILSLIPLWFGLLALATRFNHDESQYVAGAYFAARLTIFRDYLYLQPPLHAWAFAPLTLAFPAHILLAMRLATAALAVATLAALWGAQRIAGISRRSALTATMLVAATAAFQFAAGVVRNDMLPTLLVAMGMAALLLALRRGDPARWIAAGLCLGLALSAKLNFAPLALAAGLFVLAHGGPGRLRSAAWLALGGGIGLLPALVAWANAPDAFLYGVLTYGATAPHAWFALNGAGHELAWSEKLVDLLRYMARGPALLGLLLTTICWTAAGRRRHAQGRRLALWMTIGGLIGAALPTPAQLQYLMPLLPPLALALGYVLDDARRWSQPRRRAMLALLCLSAVPGLLPSVRDLARMATRGSPVLAAAADADWAGRQVRALTGDDELVTLSPHLMIDSGLTLDPRLATGPFAYRTGWTVRPDRARRLRMLTPATLADLDRDRPEAILVGYEQGTAKLPANVDRALALYAQRRGYRLLMMPDRIGRLYVRVQPEPARQASSRVGGLTRPANSLIPAAMTTPSPLAPAAFPALPDIAGVTLRVARAGYKAWERCDLTYAELAPGTVVAGVTTQSKCPSPEVEWCRDAIPLGQARALVVNAGNANAFTGHRGRAAVEAIAARVANHLDCLPSDVFVSSTGVIGVPLPVDKAEAGLDAAFAAAPCGWEEAATTIGTTDTYPKGAHASALIGDTRVELVGIIKGSGMIAPDMATMLGYIFTDAAIDPPLLQAMLSAANKRSFSCITVDSDTSTSDTVLAFATGKAGNAVLTSMDDPGADAFAAALADLCRQLAHLVVRDGEGATKFIEITVEGATSDDSAHRIGLSIANSPLVKTALAGEDANWGRVVMAIGKAGEPADRDKLSIRFGATQVATGGLAVEGYDEAPVAAHLKGQEIVIGVDLGLGEGRATIWTCDLTHGYISINADYRS